MTTPTIWKHLSTIIPFILSVFLCGIVATPVAATPSEGKEEPGVRADPPSIVSHLQMKLRESAPAQQEAALNDIINLTTTCTASCTVLLQSIGDQPVKISVENVTGVGTLVDLRTLAPDLRRVFELGSTDELRLMALSALVGIGDEVEMFALTESLSRQSERVRAAAQRAVVSYFTSVYPDLKKATDQNGGLSISQIRKAHLAKQRADRKAVRKARKEARKAARMTTQDEMRK